MIEALNNVQPVALGIAPYCSLNIYAKSKEAKPNIPGHTEVLEFLFKYMCVCVYELC